MTWVPLALSRDVPAGTTRAVILEGTEFVVWRGSAGTAQVWEDRCPHRGMRLSFGFVRENSLNCLYHGWQYGVASHCLRIPAHPDLNVPPTIKANAFASHEAGGMIWLRLGEPDAFPPLPVMMPLLSMVVDASAASILRALTVPTQAGIQMLATEIDGVSFYIGWHAVAADKTMLHACVATGVASAHAASLLQGLRGQLERGLAA